MVFAGTEKCEAIKTYDIRTRSIIYELSTGNNAVSALAWDASRNVLYAGTECNYVDRMGYHHEYRKIQHPKRTQETDDDDDEEDDEDEGRYWPATAHHDEHYFGYMFDAGEHRICECCFCQLHAPLISACKSVTPSKRILIFSVSHRIATSLSTKDIRGDSH